MKSQCVYLYLGAGLLCVHAYMCVSYSTDRIAVDRLQIHFDDSHFVCRCISYNVVYFLLYLLFEFIRCFFIRLLSRSFACLIARWDCCCWWKLITLAFMHFHWEHSLNFRFELKFNFILMLFSSLHFESLT